MDMQSKPFSCAEVNKIDMVEYLSRLGFQPKRISGHHYWYLSPFREERTASFKVNKKLNAWYDFGEGRGGTLVDFGIRYFRCSVSEFIQALSLNHSSSRRPILRKEKKNENNEGTIQINKTSTLSSPHLLAYLKTRKIDVDTAKKWCKEVSFTLYGKKYSAIGFLNDSGGYELRNSFFKGSNHPKDISTLQNGAKKLALFEGFFDFLSYQMVCKNWDDTSYNFIILNSLSFVQKMEPLLSGYEEVDSFFDRDKSGLKCTSYLSSLGSHIQDKSYLYSNHKDFNDWLQNFGLKSNQDLKLKNSDSSGSSKA